MFRAYIFVRLGEKIYLHETDTERESRVLLKLNLDGYAYQHGHQTGGAVEHFENDRWTLCLP